MPYNNTSSYNYTPMSLSQFGVDPVAGNQFGQVASQGLDFARWAAQQGIDLANLARLDRNSQLAVQNAFNQQQADRSYGLQQGEFGLQQQQFGLTKAQQEFQQRLAQAEDARRQAEANQNWFARASAQVPAFVRKPAYMLDTRTQGSYVSPDIGVDGPGFGPSLYRQPVHRTSYDPLGLEYSPV